MSMAMLPILLPHTVVSLSVGGAGHIGFYLNSKQVYWGTKYFFQNFSARCLKSLLSSLDFSFEIWTKNSSISVEFDIFKYIQRKNCQNFYFIGMLFQMDFLKFLTSAYSAKCMHALLNNMMGGHKSINWILRIFLFIHRKLFNLDTQLS